MLERFDTCESKSNEKRQIHVMYDSGLRPFEKKCVEEALQDFKVWFPERVICDHGSDKWAENECVFADWYVENAKRYMRWDGEKLDALSLCNLMRHTLQDGSPCIAILITSRDLTVEEEYFCYGKTLDSYTVQSVYRYREIDEQRLALVIKGMIWYELGQILGAARYRHSLFGTGLRPYCTNDPCVMHEWNAISTLIHNTNMANKEKIIYCPQCLQDMRESCI